MCEYLPLYSSNVQYNRTEKKRPPSPDDYVCDSRRRETQKTHLSPFL